MPRGFTLLELIITVSVLSILLAAAAPRFSRVSQTVQMQGLATELFGFLNQSRSEAVMRNKKLYVHFSMDKDNTINEGNWSFNLTDSSVAGGTSILHLSGSPYSELSINHNYNAKYISFEEVRGRPNSGNIEFFSTNNQNSKLKIKLSNPPGRIKVCSMSGAKLYDYSKC
ncbi:GspH/FimT family pseudopilin [Vibrio natriegens]|uniref:Type II secretion system protein H n=1 Tax=Vibrio natriegens NBRC 15636 = ATCC 14048 = DSM 759 TaxID=1219067 RepID=A0AAN0Y163_VIBNA|nr:GspH/FimT family pseudopilin [Vibrio natriegens]ALR16323.1 type IV pilin [Vibrio natriegens NBRC 15636 = ATCC 14048 = DSM 759]ANQ11814.1 type IV pilin [Vibrio natriegens NBRC 15636 = ATCC 14048 = DSM 759]EPM41728.1 type IV pilin [Vibrio natriegens NBRC 15636 = ATCC 14048 = DSM 759]MDX6026159.1 GspH/FimT family pseudopilin [Vibrio natriegens NBRC 15636 = ATCC 14048 = DSM 759]UUI12267.1 GspH/FimT family pseudopilin [Vibrio natriegens]